MWVADMPGSKARGASGPALQPYPHLSRQQLVLTKPAQISLSRSTCRAASVITLCHYQNLHVINPSLAPHGPALTPPSVISIGRTQLRYGYAL